ncbi:MAG TPA: hypothetical protein VHE34_06620 [Puia sp.]|uniref:hypothetical protein n=1 Tax=Puia sp. TaxID=2045100 RepID=UPI002C8B1634|nr:hypothetical protein [Puia sp.]HVU94879.1 hypothetical protein [Puia sp.]
MDTHFYLSAFESAIAKYRGQQPREQPPHDPGLLYFAGTVLGSIALKVYKPEWASDPQNPLTSPGRIFFSVWVADKPVQQNRLLYNIHALKLRQFKTHHIASRDFAMQFRTKFQPHAHEWPNLSLDYGPLTLLQGWTKLDPATLEKEAMQLIRQFHTISPLIDQTLRSFRTR